MSVRIFLNVSLALLVIAGFAIAGWAVARSADPGGEAGPAARAPAPAPAPVDGDREEAPGGDALATAADSANGEEADLRAAAAAAERRAAESLPLPVVRSDLNPSTESVAEAIRTRSHPERLSPLVRPPPFDLAEYRADPDAWCARIEPGRVFQVAQPGPGVERLLRESESTTTIPHGGSCVLAVRAVPDAPVTFHSFDLGSFDNQLTTITVRADDDGRARATFHASGGATADCHVKVASPMTTGQVDFLVTIQD